MDFNCQWGRKERMLWEIVLSITVVILTLDWLYRHRLLDWCYSNHPLSKWKDLLGNTALLVYVITCLGFTLAITQILET